MELTLLKSKIHKARLTSSCLDYEGSLEIDADILKEAGILHYEKILVVNATNGERLETYAIEGAAGSKVFCLNGAAARKGNAGDVVTIMSFAGMSMSEAVAHKPAVIVLNEKNEIVMRKGKTIL